MYFYCIFIKIPVLATNIIDTKYDKSISNTICSAIKCIRNTVLILNTAHIKWINLSLYITTIRDNYDNKYTNPYFPLLKILLIVFQIQKNISYFKSIFNTNQYKK